MKIYRQNGQWLSKLSLHGHEEIKAHESMNHALQYATNKIDEADATFTYPAGLHKEFKSWLRLAVYAAKEDMTCYSEKELKMLAVIKNFINS